MNLHKTIGPISEGFTYLAFKITILKKQDTNHFKELYSVRLLRTYITA